MGWPPDESDHGSNMVQQPSWGTCVALVLVGVKHVRPPGRWLLLLAQGPGHSNHFGGHTIAYLRAYLGTICFSMALSTKTSLLLNCWTQRCWAMEHAFGDKQKAAPRLSHCVQKCACILCTYVCITICAASRIGLCLPSHLDPSRTKTFKW